MPCECGGEALGRLTLGELEKALERRFTWILNNNESYLKQ